MSLVPYVIENTKDGERCYDIYSRLLKDRIIFVGTEIDDSVANSVVAQLLLLNNDNSSRDIEIYINSPGGVCTSGLAIVDTINYIKADVITICVGQAASMAAVLLAAGTKGKRYSLPSSRIMIHEPRTGSGAGGTCTEQIIDLEELKKIREIMATMLSGYTGQTIETVISEGKLDKYMGAEGAMDYGLIDRIITSQSQLRKESNID